LHCLPRLHTQKGAGGRKVVINGQNNWQADFGAWRIPLSKTSRAPPRRRRARIARDAVSPLRSPRCLTTEHLLPPMDSHPFLPACPTRRCRLPACCVDLPAAVSYLPADINVGTTHLTDTARCRWWTYRAPLPPVGRSDWAAHTLPYPYDLAANNPDVITPLPPARPCLLMIRTLGGTG